MWSFEGQQFRDLCYEKFQGALQYLNLNDFFV